jgi:hypothetical protein
MEEELALDDDAILRDVLGEHLFLIAVRQRVEEPLGRSVIVGEGPIGHADDLAPARLERLVVDFLVLVLTEIVDARHHLRLVELVDGVASGLGQAINARTRSADGPGDGLLARRLDLRGLAGSVGRARRGQLADLVRRQYRDLKSAHGFHHFAASFAESTKDDPAEI